MRLYMQNRPVDMQLPTGAGLYFGLRFAIMYAMSDLSHSPSPFMARRKANNEMPLAKELIITLSSNLFVIPLARIGSPMMRK